MSNVVDMGFYTDPVYVKTATDDDGGDHIYINETMYYHFEAPDKEAFRFFYDFHIPHPDNAFAQFSLNELKELHAKLGEIIKLRDSGCIWPMGLTISPINNEDGQ